MLINISPLIHPLSSRQGMYHAFRGDIFVGKDQETAKGRQPKT